MRVISGTYRGRKLFCPEGLSTRPTLDRIKENLFNLLPDPSGLRVLDLFSGAGGLGIEALSRGAASVDFCDCAEVAVRALRRNLEGMRGDACIHVCDVERALGRFGAAGETFDLILMDPPYRGGFYEPVCRRILECKLLEKNGLLAAESEAALGIDFGRFGYEIVKDRKYGAVRLTLLKEIES